MPIYEYRCQRCKQEFELLVSASNREKKVICPHCRNRKVDRLISNFAFSSGEGGSRSSKSCATCSSSNCSTCT